MRYSIMTFFIVIGCRSCVVFAQGTETLYLSTNNNEYKVSKEWSVWEDSTGGKLSIDEVCADSIQRRFVSVSKGTLPTQLREVVYWLRIRIVDTLSLQPSVWMLVSKDFAMKKIEIFLPNQNTMHASHIAYSRFVHGNTIPLEERSIEWYGIAQTFVLQPRIISTIYCRITSHYVGYGTTLMSPSYFALHTLREHYRFGLFYGAMLLLAVYNTILCELRVRN